MNSILEVIKKLDESIPVVWDRFTKTDDGYYVVYGWIVRSDGQRDFIMFEMWEYEKPENVAYATSSAKFSRRISEILYGHADDHNECRKIEELWTSQTSQPNS